MVLFIMLGGVFHVRSNTIERMGMRRFGGTGISEQSMTFRRAGAGVSHVKFCL
jgi:pyruvate/2-oxoglutarate/acetoin dehydrogenase E1 component